MDIYTINGKFTTSKVITHGHCTALYNPLIDDSDIKTIQKLTRTPSQPIPSLLELSGRAVFKHSLQWKPGDIPKRLEGKNIWKRTINFEVLSFSNAT